MTTHFRRSFERDLRRIRDRRVLDRVREVIEAVEAADALSDLPNLKKIRGGDGYFRARVGDYRIGLFVESGEVEFVRVLPRRDIYRYFP